MTFKPFIDLLLLSLTSAILYTIIFFFLEKRPHKKTYKRLFMHYGLFIVLCSLLHILSYYNSVSSFILSLYLVTIVLSFIAYYLLFIIYYLLFRKYLGLGGLLLFFLVVLLLSIVFVGYLPVIFRDPEGYLTMFYFMLIGSVCVALFLVFGFIQIYRNFKKKPR